MSKPHTAGHEVVDSGANRLDPSDDCPGFVVLLAEAVVAGKVERGVASFASGAGAAVRANKVRGGRAGLIHVHFSAKQRVENDHMNILRVGGRSVGSEVA
jgi:ribose 5-phosphate isomerase B